MPIRVSHDIMKKESSDCMNLKEGLIISGISVLVSSIIILSRKKKINID